MRTPAGAWSSDVVSGPVDPDRPGHHEKVSDTGQAGEDKKAEKSDKGEKADKAFLDDLTGGF